MKKYSRGYISDGMISCLFTLGFLGIMGGLFGGIFWMDYYKCSLQADKLRLEADWGPIQGCLVKFDETRWVDIDRIRINENGRLGVGVAED